MYFSEPLRKKVQINETLPNGEWGKVYVGWGGEGGYQEKNLGQPETASHLIGGEKIGTALQGSNPRSPALVIGLLGRDAPVLTNRATGHR